MARAGFRVVLDGAARDVLEDEALDGPVVEIEMGELGLAEVGLPADRFIPIDLPGAIRPWTAKPWFWEVMSIRRFRGP